MGDLEEEFATLVLPASGRRQARRWYLQQIARSLYPMAVQRLRQSSMIWCAIGVALAGLAVVLTFVLLTAAALAMFKIVAVPEGARLLTYVTIGFIAAAAGGFVGGILPVVGDRRGWMGLAALVLLLFVAVFAGTPEGQPIAAWVVWSLFLSSGLMTGRGLASRVGRRPTTIAR